MKAKSLGLPAQDYTSDKVEIVRQALHRQAGDRGRAAARLIIAVLRQRRPRARGGGRRASTSPLPNENFILRNGSKSVLATYRAAEQAVRARREGDDLRHLAAQRRAVVRPQGPDQRRHQAGHARRQGRHRQDAARPGRGARMPAALSADPAGPAGRAAGQPRPGLPARRHRGQARSVHAAAVRQPDRDPPPVRRQRCRRPSGSTRCARTRSW